MRRGLLLLAAGGAALLACSDDAGVPAPRDGGVVDAVVSPDGAPPADGGPDGSAPPSGIPEGYGPFAATTHDLFVAPNGDDKVSYAANDLAHPWKTLGHALYRLKAGDRLLVRGGVYAPTYPIWLTSDYARQTKGGDPNEVNEAQSGTKTAPVVVEAYANETPVVDLGAISGGFIQLDDKSYWVFRGLHFTHSQVVFAVGEDHPTTWLLFDALDIAADRGGDNMGGIALLNGNAQWVTIRRCRIRGPGIAPSLHQNTNAIYLKTQHVKILGNELGNAPIGIYFKHASAGKSYADVDVEVAYNFIDVTSRSSLEYNGNYTTIHDNVFGKTNGAIHLNDGNGGPGGDYNLIEHNTVAGGGVVLDGSQETSPADIVPGAYGNVLRANVFAGLVDVFPYHTEAHATVLDGNLYGAGVHVAGATVPIDGKSLAGTAVYLGPTTTTFDDFHLQKGSPGSGAAPGPTDMGIGFWWGLPR